MMLVDFLQLVVQFINKDIFKDDLDNGCYFLSVLILEFQYCRCYISKSYHSGGSKIQCNCNRHCLFIQKDPYSYAGSMCDSEKYFISSDYRKILMQNVWYNFLSILSI